MLHTAGSFLLKKNGYIKRNLELETEPNGGIVNVINWNC